MRTYCLTLLLVVLLCTPGQSSAQNERFRNSDMEKEEEEKELLEHPAARTEWEFERTRDPRTGTVPANIKARENAFVSRLPARYHSGKNSTQAMQWMPAGPMNVGGRTRALAFDINNTGVMLAGAVSGGMWRSTDDGESWTKVTAPNELQSVSCVVQDIRPGKTNTWYYGTGELLSTTDRRVDTIKRTLATGNGIYKSIDNGATWHLLPATDGGAEGVLQEHFQGVWRLATDRSNTVEDELYAACYGGIMRSLDGGDSWKLALGSTEKKAFNSEVAITSTGVVYGAVGSLRDTSKSPKQGVWRSVDGVQWTDITPPDFPVHVRRIVLAVAPSNEKVMYVLTETPLILASGIYDFAASRHSLWKYTYKSGDGSGNGGEWVQLSDKIPGGPTSLDLQFGFNTLGGYCMVLMVHPANPNAVFLGGTNLFRTVDGFASSQTVLQIGGYPSSWEDDKLHPDLHTIAFSPDLPSVMCVGGDGGLTWSYNNLENTVQWSVKNNGYISSQFYSVSMDHAQANDPVIVGGLQDNGSFITGSHDPQEPWNMLYGGDGTGCAVANNQTAVYVSSQSGNVLQWKYLPEVQGYGFSGFTVPYELRFEDFNFITLFALEPTETNIMYLVAKSRLWRYNDLANTPPFWNGEPDLNWEEMPDIGTNGASIISLCPSVQPAHRLYLGTHDGHLLRIDNANTNAYTVSDITGDQFPDGAVVSSISVDPDNADLILVSFSNYNVPSLFYSSNGGLNWTDVSGNLEEHPNGSGAGPSVRCVKIHRTGNIVYYFAGTSAGLYSTTNLAGAQTIWEQEGPTVVGNVLVEAIDSRMADGRVIIGTQGNGVFAANLPAVSVGEKGPAAAVLLEQNHPNPAKNTTRIGFHIPTASPVTITLYNTLGERLLTPLNETLPAGGHHIDIPLSDLAPGAYFYRLQVGNVIQTRKMTVVR